MGAAGATVAANVVAVTELLKSEQPAVFLAFIVNSYDSPSLSPLIHTDC